MKTINLEDLEDYTIEGFPVKDLLDFAILCREEDLTPEDLVNLNNNMDCCMQFCEQEFIKAMEKAIDKRFKKF